MCPRSRSHQVTKLTRDLNQRLVTGSVSEMFQKREIVMLSTLNPIYSVDDATMVTTALQVCLSCQ